MITPQPLALPRCILSAASSDSGKTILTLGLVAALRRRHVAVVAHKVGPDFIDSAHLAHVSGRPARNLDAFLAPEPVVLRSFLRGSIGADIALIEGVMGLFDGRHGTGEGSTAHIARLLDAPVILVLDCGKSAATVGAVAYGLANLDRRIRIAGAILNRVASDSHAATVSDAVRRAGVPVLGIVRRDPRLAFGSRHLGLNEPGHEGWAETVEAAADVVTECVDLDALLTAAQSAPALVMPPQPSDRSACRRVRVALARDEAFWFYDHASLEALRDAGAELVEYSPMRDVFPDVDAAFIGGGYPELHAAQLAENSAARNGLRQAAAAGMPIYAECGGLMYLTQALENSEGIYPMAEIIAARSTMSKKRSALRYVEAKTLGDGPMFAHNVAVRGHEFHYSTTEFSAPQPVFTFADRLEGYRSATIHASYVHVHLGAYQSSIERFLDTAAHVAGVR